jgi:hypothetical protein
VTGLLIPCTHQSCACGGLCVVLEAGKQTICEVITLEDFYSRACAEDAVNTDVVWLCDLPFDLSAYLITIGEGLPELAPGFTLPKYSRVRANS